MGRGCISKIMPKRLLYILLFNLCCSIQLVYAQTSLKKYVRGNAVCLKTENALLINELDLQFLDTIAKSHRIILLGESTHCDSITPVIKAKMVEYLYRKHGFEVLCFESDFFSINQTWFVEKDKTKADKAFIDSNITFMFIRPNIYKYVFEKLLPYIKEENNGLLLSGFDNQIGGQNFKQQFPIVISNYLKNINRKSSVKFSEADLEFLTTLNSTYFYDPSKVDTNQLITIKNSISNLINNLDRIGDFKNDFEYLALENLMSLCKMNLSVIQSDNDSSGFNIRDKQMANNISWIINTLYPNKKIIIWSHNIHSMYNTSYAYPGYISAAEILKNSLLYNELYSIGFTSRNVYTCMWPRDTVSYLFSSKRKRTIEDYFPQKEFYFLDLKGHENEVVRSLVFRSYLTIDGYPSRWFQGFDGIFYIKTLHPTTF